MDKKLKFAFSYFGGKSRVAPIIWKGLGDISNYVEPFVGSLSILLASPKIVKMETINDKNCYISNFYRAISKEPEEVAKYADYPVSEIDVHARQNWLSSITTEDLKNKMENDPEYYDCKMAGYWIYGHCASIGDNWLKTKGLNAVPVLSCAGTGIHGLNYKIGDNFKNLQARLRRVRICCGDWTRVVAPSVTYKNKGLTDGEMTGVVLDPPYSKNNRSEVYFEDNNIFKDVCDWAVENGNNPKLRIVLCGYDGDYVMPKTWQTYSWKASGGMSSLGNDRGKENSKKEMIWFSPNCLKI